MSNLLTKKHWILCIMTARGVHRNAVFSGSESEILSELNDRGVVVVSWHQIGLEEFLNIKANILTAKD